MMARCSDKSAEKFLKPTLQKFPAKTFQPVDSETGRKLISGRAGFDDSFWLMDFVRRQASCFRLEDLEKAFPGLPNRRRKGPLLS